MMQDPLYPISAHYIRNVQEILRADRKDLLSRVQTGAHAGVDEETIQVYIDGTTVQVKKKLEAVAYLYLDQIYIRSLTQTISQIALMYPGSGMPGYITREERDKVKGEVAYAMELISSILSQRNEAIQKTIFSGVKGISRLVNETKDEITQKWFGKIEESVRVGMMHTWNYAAWSRIQKYSTGKQWVSGPVSDVPDHPGMNGSILPVDTPFKVPEFHPGGDKRRKPVPGCEMMYPGDTTFTPDIQHLVGCWCRVEPAEFFG
jgi:hypothetical protein